MAARTIDTRYVINHIVILCSEKGGVDQCVHADKGDKCTHPDFVPPNGIQATALYALENSTALNETYQKWIRNGAQVKLIPDL